MNTSQNLAQNADALDAAHVRSERGSRPCQCGNFVDTTTGQNTGCEADTLNTFAPGHDAKLKGFLIRAGRAGHQVRLLGTEDEISPLAAASRYGFASLVADGIKRQPKKAKKTAAPEKVTAKVGRWEYRGLVEGAEFVYTDRKGAERRTEKFTWV